MCVQKIKILGGKIDFVVRVNKAKRIFKNFRKTSSAMRLDTLRLFQFIYLKPKYVYIFQVQSMDIAAFNKV